MSSSLDGTVRVHDLTVAKAIDIMLFQSPPMSVSLAPTGEFMKSLTHVESRAVCLWENRMYFESGVKGTRVVKKPVHMVLPDVAAEVENDEMSPVRLDDGDISESDESDAEDFDVSKLPPPTGYLKND